MIIIRLLPVLFSFLILSAHFFRQDLLFLSILFLIIPFLLLITRTWVARSIQVILIIGAIEWIRTLSTYVIQRQAVGAPYIRLIIILGIVALFTGLSALVFRSKVLKKRYNF
ncbi:hypothetical protein KKF86_00070 [bacterium]|nr:hypothetical protein [bacterium]